MVAGYLSLLYSISDKPLEYWSKRQSSTGRIRKILDSDLLENVVEIQDLEQFNINNTSIACPSNPLQLLDIKLPFLVIIIKNLNIECRIRLQVIDTKNRRHHFQFSSAEFEKDTRVQEPTICRVKLKLESNWNKLELDLPTLTNDAFKCRFVAVQRLEICANCRLRRIYFVDKHYQDYEVSAELWQAFLDSYMLKWNIHTADAVAQIPENEDLKSVKAMTITFPTNETISDPVSKSPNHAISKSQNIKRGNSSKKNDFLKTLQIKTSRLIDDFFNRQNIRIINIKDFKRQAKMKPYSLQLIKVDKLKKHSSNGNLSINSGMHYINLDLTAGFSHSQIMNGFTSTNDYSYRNQGLREKQKSENRDMKWKNKSFFNKPHSAKDVYSLDKNKKVQSISFMSSPTVDHEKRFLDMQNYFQKKKNKINNITASHKSESYMKTESGIFKKYANIPKSDLKTFTSVTFDPMVSIFKQAESGKTSVPKKDSILQRTIFDLRRTYMNLIDKDVPNESQS